MYSRERPTANAAVQSHGGFYCPLSEPANWASLVVDVKSISLISTQKGEGKAHTCAIVNNSYEAGPIQSTAVRAGVKMALAVGP